MKIGWQILEKDWDGRKTGKSRLNFDLRLLISWCWINRTCDNRMLELISWRQLRGCVHQGARVRRSLHNRLIGEWSSRFTIHVLGTSGINTEQNKLPSATYNSMYSCLKRFTHQGPYSELRLNPNLDWGPSQAWRIQIGLGLSPSRSHIPNTILFRLGWLGFGLAWEGAVPSAANRNDRCAEHFYGEHGCRSRQAAPRHSRAA